MLEASDFVKAVMERLKVGSPAELAETMRWKRGTERLVAKWIAGNNRPSYGYMLEMIDKAGLLNMNAETPVPAADAATAGHQAEIAEGIVRLERGMAKLLEDRQADVQPPRARPKQK